jgi:hypothetical protein
MTRCAGYGVEGQGTGADLEDPGYRVGLEVGCGGFDGDHLPVVVAGQQDEAVPGLADVVVDGGQQDVAVVVEQDPGDSVLLVLDAAGCLVEKVEGELEFVLQSA